MLDAPDIDPQRLLTAPTRSPYRRAPRVQRAADQHDASRSHGAVAWRIAQAVLTRRCVRYPRQDDARNSCGLCTQDAPRTTAISTIHAQCSKVTAYNKQGRTCNVLRRHGPTPKLEHLASHPRLDAPTREMTHRHRQLLADAAHAPVPVHLTVL